MAMDKAERKEIVELVAIGRSDDEIGTVLDITRRQARRRVEWLMNHYKAATRTYMVVKAIAHEDIDAKELARLTALVAFLTAANVQSPIERIAPKSAPKRNELQVRRALPKYDIEQYQAA